MKYYRFFRTYIWTALHGNAPILIFLKILHSKNVYEGEQLVRALHARSENAGIDWIMTCSFLCNARNVSKHSK
jgi:hypothetical protein